MKFIENSCENPNISENCRTWPKWNFYKWCRYVIYFWKISKIIQSKVYEPSRWCTMISENLWKPSKTLNQPDNHCARVRCNFEEIEHSFDKIFLRNRSYTVAVASTARFTLICIKITFALVLAFMPSKVEYRRVHKNSRAILIHNKKSERGKFNMTRIHVSNIKTLLFGNPRS